MLKFTTPRQRAKEFMLLSIRSLCARFFKHEIPNIHYRRTCRLATGIKVPRKIHEPAVRFRPSSRTKKTQPSRVCYSLQRHRGAHALFLRRLHVSLSPSLSLSVSGSFTPHITCIHAPASLTSAAWRCCAN